jgi:hypothetical protein
VDGWVGRVCVWDWGWVCDVIVIVM